MRYLRNRSRVLGPTPWMALACSRLRTRDVSLRSEPTILNSVFDHCASMPCGLRSTEDSIMYWKNSAYSMFCACLHPSVFGP